MQAADATGAFLKAARGAYHLDQLFDQSVAFIEGKDGHGPSHRFVTEIETMDDGERWKVTRLEVLREPPATLGLILGDGFHNLRSALDHLATQLWRLNKRTPPKAGANFPVYVRPLSERDRHNLSSALKGMHKEHADHIRSLQPYKATTDPVALALGVLATFDNYDKHELIHPTFASVIAPAMPSLEMFGMQMRFAPPGPLSHGDEVMAFRSSNPQHYTLQNQLGPRVQVSFGDPPITVNEVGGIHNRVMDVLEHFVWEFPKGDWPTPTPGIIP